MQISRALVCAIFALPICHQAAAQTPPAVPADEYINITTTAIPFLRIATDARSSSLGNCGIATSPDALVNGKYFKILEVNGSEAESTHIYDRKYTFFYAYKTLYQQWNTLFKIAKLNRKNGFYGLTAKRFFSEYIGFINENQVIKSD